MHVCLCRHGAFRASCIQYIACFERARAAIGSVLCDPIGGEMEAVHVGASLCYLTIWGRYAQL